jgi:hypothetical protein
VSIFATDEAKARRAERALDWGVAAFYWERAGNPAEAKICEMLNLSRNVAADWRNAPEPRPPFKVFAEQHPDGKKLIALFEKK